MSYHPRIRALLISAQLTNVLIGEVWRGPGTLWVPPPDLPNGGGAGAAGCPHPEGTRRRPRTPTKRLAINAEISNVGGNMRFHTRSVRFVTAFGVALAFAMSSVMVAFAATSTISNDPFTQATCAASNTTNHHTEVEPDTFSNGSTIVATFQVGRIFDGGACDLGFATPIDNGSNWTSGLLPGITKWSGSGPYDRVSDPAVAYDAAHGVWLISSLAISEAGGVHGVAVLTSSS